MSRIFIACCVLFGFTVSAMSQSRKSLPTERARLATIESYVGEVDRFIKLQAKSARIFANVAPYNEADRWREFKTENETLSVIRDSVYGTDGPLLRRKTKYLDLRSRKPAKPTNDFVDELHPVYRRVKDLPFYKLL